ncbi:MAG: hypothetical protein ABIW38_11800 [Ferruginibacter sp.]
MTKLNCLFIFLIPLFAYAHPGVGIVKDSKGNIFFTDLHQVWKIHNGKKTVVVPNVHTHELYIDKYDNLFGEGGYYDDKAIKFYHYLWVLRPNGRVDTVIGMKEAYVRQDFSLARDKDGNEYYIKRFLVPHIDTNHIYKKTPNGKETVLATGNFKKVNWLHPQDDGSILYAAKNIIFRVDSLGNIRLVTDQIRNSKSLNSKDDILIWGIWQDSSKNIYAAVFSDKTIKKIDHSGNITTIYTSKENWSPLHGAFDNKNKLWVLEGSDNNEARVISAEMGLANSAKQDPTKSMLLPYIMLGGLVLIIGILYLKTKNKYV